MTVWSLGRLGPIAQAQDLRLRKSLSMRFLKTSLRNLTTFTTHMAGRRLGAPAPRRFFFFYVGPEVGRYNDRVSE